MASQYGLPSFNDAISVSGVSDTGSSWTPGSASTMPNTQVEISMSCRKLADMDTFSKSDPFCVLYMKPFGAKDYIEVGRTETIQDTLNPDFVKTFIVDYYFEESQKLRFDIYDSDSSSKDLRHHDFLGCLNCTLGEMVSSVRLVKRLQRAPRNKGVIMLRAEEISSCKDEIHLHFEGRKLDKKDFLGKSDPFLVFSRLNDDNSWTVAHKTEVIKNTLNPHWSGFSVPVRVLCKGNHDMPIRIECYDWNHSGNHDIIGEFTTSVAQMREARGSMDFEVINKKKAAKKKKYTNSGIVTLLRARVQPMYSFMDFIKGGMQLNFTVAIDFTASNGDPRKQGTLHYGNPTTNPSQYARALKAVGEIIQDYDSDQLFPALGFGAKIPPRGHVSHQFHLNRHPTNADCQGIQGVLDAYHNMIRCVELYGPTNFAPVINWVASKASQFMDGSEFSVLLILTDGVITDMPQTKQAIVQAAMLPMSIIIVGIGGADFEAMNELDGDDLRLSWNGVFAQRDIVQFVPFRDFIGGKYGNNLAASQVYLAKEVLAEVPDQITGYMKDNNIQPRTPPPTPLTPSLAGTDEYTCRARTSSGRSGGSGQGYDAGIGAGGFTYPDIGRNEPPPPYPGSPEHSPLQQHRRDTYPQKHPESHHTTNAHQHTQQPQREERRSSRCSSSRSRQLHSSGHTQYETHPHHDTHTERHTPTLR